MKENFLPLDVYPGAVWRPIPEDATQPAITPTQIILHTAADAESAKTLFDWWNSLNQNLESHVYVTRSGVIEQYIRCSVRADANNRANRRPDGTGAISVETYDGRGSGLPESAWSDAQLDTIVAFLDWACTEYGIPRRLCTGPDDPGIGYHNLFPEWSPKPTGCPGPIRAAQVRDVILPRLNSLAPVAGASSGGLFNVLDSLTLPGSHPTLPNCGVEVRAVMGGVAIRWQPMVGKAWGDWNILPSGKPDFPVSAVNLRCAYDGTLDVLAWDAADPGKGVLRASQLAPGGQWSRWNKA